MVLPFAGWSQDVATLHETAKSFMRSGDYANAILVLNRGISNFGKQAALVKDLALCYYFQNDPQQSLATIKPLLQSAEADDQCYQIAGNAYKALDQKKEGEKSYKKGIKKFPESGALYNELGELLWSQNKYDAIQYWEKGIKKAPGYAKNYYNASRYYFLTTDKVWSILYGEIFVNMEPQNPKSSEIKEILFNGYKKLFADASLTASGKQKNTFTGAFLQDMNLQTSVATEGITLDGLLMIRTRFILDWSQQHRQQYPHRLFEYHKQLLQEGLFEAYHQWLFGSSDNLAAFQQWTKAHAREYNSFLNFQQSRLFKMPEGQYYH